MAHYFDSQPESPDRPREVNYRFDGRDYVFETASGVFSGSRVDRGTQVLLAQVVQEFRSDGIRDGRLLDLGCGYGPVGIIMKRTFPALDVTFLDINNRALTLAEKNAKRNQVRYATYRSSDGFADDETTYDLILTNPPIRAGKAVVFSFYEGACEHLKKGGRLYVVIRKKQGAPSSMARLEELFGSCELLVRESGYHVLRCIK